MSYTVYKHTSPGGKVYIGITGRRPERRWHGGSAYRNNPHFYSSIKKYGWSSFTHEILASGLTKEQACELEIKLIQEHNSTDPSHGYNRSIGGDKTTMGYSVSEETKEKIRAKSIGRKNPHTEEWNRKIGEANRGHTVSEETRDKLRSCLGDRFITPEARAKQKANSLRGWDSPRAKHVRCVETGEVFGTIIEASTKYGLSRNCIGLAASGKQHTAGGLHWRYADEETT